MSYEGFVISLLGDHDEMNGDGFARLCFCHLKSGEWFGNPDRPPGIVHDEIVCLAVIFPSESDSFVFESI